MNELGTLDYKSCYTLCNETPGCGGVAYFTKFYPVGSAVSGDNPGPMVCQLKTAVPATDPLCGNLEPAQAVSGRLCTDDPGMAHTVWVNFYDITFNALRLSNRL